MQDNKEPGPASKLRQRISELRKEDVPEEPEQKPMPSALNISIELVAGVLVGAFLGFHLDKWAGTSPLFFILLFFLGLAGGSLNIYKLATRDMGKPSEITEKDNNNKT